MFDFSVAMSVYKNDIPEWFDLALESISVSQSIKPNEIVLVCDGPISNGLEEVIIKYKKVLSELKIAFSVIRLEQNCGLGNALRIAIENCSYDYVARMDSDDIAVESRFEQQISFFITHPEVDILSGDIQEFEKIIEHKIGKRKLPVSHEEIKKYIKYRCPINHMAVMYKKAAVINAGNYKEWFYNEDYYLWIRMLLNGAIFANTGTTLVNVRVGKDMYRRRGGKKYFESEFKLQIYLYRNSIINIKELIINILKRFIVQLLLPNGIRAHVFRIFARTKD